MLKIIQAGLFGFFLAFIHSSALANTAPLKVYAVTGVKQGDSLNMRAWPNPNSRILVAMPHNSKWVASNTKPKKYGKSTWIKVHWNGDTGWVNSRYLKYDPVRTKKARERRDHRLKKQGKNTKTSNQFTSKQVIMACGGNQPFWNIDMNLTSHILNVNLRNGQSFNTAITHRNWSDGNNRMTIHGGRGRNAIRATLVRTNSCTDGITNIRYPFLVNASIGGNRQVSGCCRTFQR